MNIVEHVSLLPVGISSGYMPGEVLLDLPVVLCLIFWGTTRLISRVVVPACNPTNNGISPHPHQHLLSTEFLILTILTGVKWNLRVVLICIFLMIKDVEHFFRCFSAIRFSSGENSLFSSEHHFLMGFFEFLKSTFLSPLYMLDNSPLSDLG